MQVQKIVRPLLYSVIAVVVAAVAVLGLTIYTRGLRVPKSILNAGVAQSIALRYGVRYNLESLHVGCLGRNCPGEVDAGALDIEILIPELLRVHLNETHSRRGNSATVRGLDVRSGDRPPLVSVENLQSDPLAGRTIASGIQIAVLPENPPVVVGSVELDGASKQVTARGIRLSSASVDTIQLQGWAPTPDNFVAVNRLDVIGVTLSLPERPASNATICEQVPSSSDFGGQALEAFRPLLPLLQKDIQILNGDLLRLALALGIAILIFKLMSVLWLWRSPLFFLLPVFTAAAPFALYQLFRSMFSTGRLVMVACGVLFALAVLFRIFVYRRGERWYQRWEPFVVDLASIVVLLPLLGYGFELPPFPSPPAGLKLERIEVAGISGRTSAAQFDISQASIRGLRVALPGIDPELAVGVTSIQIPKANIIARPSSRIALNGMMIDDVSVLYDPNRKEVGRIAANLRLAGLFESDALRHELRNIEFLRGVDLRSRVGFDVDVRASGPDGPPALSTLFPDSTNPVAVNAAVLLRPIECTVSFDIASRVLTQPLMMTVRADGDSENIRIRSLQSLPRSPIQIARGSGSVVLSGSPKVNLNLESLGGSFGSTQLEVSSIGITASIPPPGKSGMQLAAIAVGPTSIRPASGWNIRAGQSTIQFDRMPDQRIVPVTFEARIENVQLEGPDKHIEANFPALLTRVSGHSTPEAIPHQFNGTLDFFAFGANASDELAGTNRPISFNADLWKGRFDIPEQEIIFSESIISGTRTEIPVQFKLAGRLSSIVPRLNADIETKAELSHFEPDAGSSRVTLDDAHVSARADWNDQGATAGLNYGIGSTRIALSPGPTAVCLDEISTLNLSASGTISRIPQSGGLLPSLTLTPTQAPSPCASLPLLPEAIGFQVSGSYPPGPLNPLFRLARENGTGIQIRSIGSNIGSLRILDGRLVSLETRADIHGVESLHGSGGIDIQADLRQAKDSLQLDSRISAPDGTVLLEAAVATTPERITLDAMQHVPADRILAQLKPFLSDLQIDLGSVNAQARLTQLHAEANFENGELRNAAVEAKLDRGAIVSVDSTGLHTDVSTTPVGTEPLLHLTIGGASGPNGARRIVASAGVPGALVHAVTGDSGTIDVQADLSVIAQGTLFMSGVPPKRPVLDKVFDVASGLRRETSLLATLLDTPATSSPMNNIQWNIRLAQNSAASALFRLAPDALEMHLTDASFDAAWDSSASLDRSRIAVSTALDSRISIEGNEVLLDILFPIAATYALEGQPETQIDANIPIQVAFAGRLNEAPESSDSLWNRDYYAQFWRDHPSRFAGPAFASPIDFNEMLLGPLSVRQIRFPLEPLRLLIGYSEALQVGLPFSGHALYGGVAGNLESSITTSNGVATLDTRLNLDLKNLQAGAIGSTRGGGHSAFVEDELDGRVALRLDGLKMDRTTLPALRAGHASPSDLEKVGMSVHLFRSRESGNLPGVLQASSDVQINLVNEVLNQIIKDLRLPAPPRALTYRNMALNFDVDRGRVRTDGEVFTLGGLQLFSTDAVDVTGEVRAHLGRPGERIMLGNLVEMIGSLSSATETGGE